MYIPAIRFKYSYFFVYYNEYNHYTQLQSLYTTIIIIHNYNHYTQLQSLYTTTIIIHNYNHYTQLPHNIMDNPTAIHNLTTHIAGLPSAIKQLTDILTQRIKTVSMSNHNGISEIIESIHKIKQLHETILQIIPDLQENYQTSLREQFVCRIKLERSNLQQIESHIDNVDILHTLEPINIPMIEPTPDGIYQPPHTSGVLATSMRCDDTPLLDFRKALLKGNRLTKTLEVATLIEPSLTSPLTKTQLRSLANFNNSQPIQFNDRVPEYIQAQPISISPDSKTKIMAHIIDMPNVTPLDIGYFDSLVTYCQGYPGELLYDPNTEQFCLYMMNMLLYGRVSTITTQTNSNNLRGLIRCKNTVDDFGRILDKYTSSVCEISDCTFYHTPFRKSRSSGNGDKTRNIYANCFNYMPDSSERRRGHTFASSETFDVDKLHVTEAEREKLVMELMHFILMLRCITDEIDSRPSSYNPITDMHPAESV